MPSNLFDPSVPTSTTTSTAASTPTPLQYISTCDLPTPWATFRLHAFMDAETGKEHLAMALGAFDDGVPVLMRMHSECLTGDALFSQRCDCGAQLEASLQKIATEGRGVLLYLRQEGRGIGLLNKLRAYHLQDGGADTVEANQALGFMPDQRHYGLVVPMLSYLGIHALRVMTNNPRKIAALTALGFDVVERIPLLVQRNTFNTRYLDTKAAKLGHLIQS